MGLPSDRTASFDLPTNGHGSSLTGNGHTITSHAVGGSDGAEYEAAGPGHFKPLWKGSQLDRKEFVRIALQAFNEMGYQ